MIKKLFAVNLVLFMTLTLIGCGNSKEEEIEVQKTKLEEHKGIITRFLDALAADDYKKLSEFLYSDPNNDFKDYCENTQTNQGIDFSEGYELIRYTEEYYMDSEGDVEGTLYIYEAKVNFGEEKCYVALQILDDGKKAGIVSFEVGHRSYAQ